MPSILEGFIRLIGALGLFLYSITRFGDGIQKIFGEKIRVILERQSRQPFSNILNGVVMAAALQSNFLTFGMISSLINAGLLGILPAILIMLGVNLGMTVTTQLMSLNIGVLLFILLFSGYLFYSYGKTRSWHHLGQILFNLGLMYLSFNMFHQSFQIIGIFPSAVQFIKTILTSPWMGFLLGVSLAVLIRSSNTIVVLTQGLVGLELAFSSEVFLSGAFAIVIGANVGTTIINMLIGMDRLPIVKKANWLHLTYNLSTGLIWLIFLPIAFVLVNSVSQYLREFFQIFVSSVFKWKFLINNYHSQWFYIWQIAMAHTIFNFTVILIWFPATYLAAKLGFPLLVEKGKINSANSSTYLDRRALQTPALALMLASHEIKQMATITLGMLRSSRLAFVKGQIHLLDNITRDENIVDDLQEQITFYLSALLSQNSLTESQSHRLAGLLHIVSDIERVGDHGNNIANLAEKKYQEQLQFSELAINEIELMFGKAIDVYQKASLAFSEDKPELAKQILGREENIDKLEEELRQNHIHRLNQGKCWPSSGVVYVEMLSNLQRIAAHSANIASAILEEGDK